PTVIRQLQYALDQGSCVVTRALAVEVTWPQEVFLPSLEFARGSGVSWPPLSVLLHNFFDLTPNSCAEVLLPLRVGHLPKACSQESQITKPHQDGQDQGCFASLPRPHVAASRPRLAYPAQNNTLPNFAGLPLYLRFPTRRACDSAEGPQGIQVRL